MNRSRVVIDTTCLISAYINPLGKSAQAVEKAREGYEVVISPETFAELAEVIQRAKFDRFASVQERDRFLQRTYEVSVVHEQTHDVKACRDPKDDKFLSLALSSGAETIISSDAHLQEMKHFRGVQIWSPAQFLERDLARLKTEAEMVGQHATAEEPPKRLGDRLREIEQEIAAETPQQRAKREAAERLGPDRQQER